MGKDQRFAPATTGRRIGRRPVRLLKKSSNLNMSTQTATEQLFRIANRTPFNIAPKQGEQLATNIFGDRKWRIEPGNGKANFEAVPSKATIILHYSGLASLWCTSYAAFHIMDVASRAQRAADYNISQHIDIGKECQELNVNKHVNYAKSLFAADSPWPNELNMPNPSAPLDSKEGRINNVFFGALSWILLHEIAHVYHNDSALVPSYISISQEYKADAFATQWILSDAGFGLQREFRVLMISVALCWLFMLESVRGQGTSHPATILRLREAANQFDVGERSAGIENACYVFKAILDPQGPAAKMDSPREMFGEICNRLEELFPVRNR